MRYRYPSLHCLWLVLAVTTIFSELVATEENLARNHPALSSGANWGNFKPAALTDGDPSTFTHPLASSGTRGFYYQVDLGHSHRLERILLRNRADGCCTERLSRIRVEIFADDGDSIGEPKWSGTIRGDGSNSGIAGVDTITAGMGSGVDFAGRYVRIVNTSGAAYNPQLAEIEVYGGTLPVIRQFSSDVDLIRHGESAKLRWVLEGAMGAAIEPDVGPIDPRQGEVTVMPDTTTEFRLVATNLNGSVTSTATVGVDVTLLPPILSEFLADNSGGEKDEDGDASDWIEVYNPNSFRCNVGGYFLTDDPRQLTKWRLPSVSIPAREFLLLFASGKDRRDPSGELHTNFKLDAGGDYLALVDRDGRTVLEQFPRTYPHEKTYPRQSRNASFGLDPDGAGGFMRPPTPRSANGSVFSGVVDDLQFSKEHGFFDSSFAVAITTDTSGATIRYTTDASEPTAATGQIYTSPLLITKSTIVRAAAFKEGWAPTAIGTQSYIFPGNVLGSPNMRRSITTNTLYAPQLRSALLDLPSVSLVSSRSVNDTAPVRASFEWVRPDGEQGVQENCGAIHFGGEFTDFAKKSFRLFFRREFGAPKLQYPLFEGFEHGFAAVDEFDQLELRSGSHDMEMRGFYMSNIFVDDTLLEMGHLNPHGRFVHLYLNGNYWGVYHLRERWGASMHARYLGGANADYESINGNWNVGGWAEPGSPYDGDGSTWAYVKSLRTDYMAIKPWLDVPNYIDYMLVWMFGGAEDEYRCVGPTVPGSGFKFYVNDADGWFCIPSYCAADDRTARGAPGRQPGDGPGSLFSTLLKANHPDYRVLLADHIYNAMSRNGPLSPPRTESRLAARTTELERPFLVESARWGYLTPKEWGNRRNSAMTNWLPRRTTEAFAQFRAAGFYPTLDAPETNPGGGIVPMGSPVRFVKPLKGTIWYTTDGSDPRLPGGAVSSSAKGIPISDNIDSPIVITRNTVLKCRAINGSQWSALNELFFQVGQAPGSAGDVTVTELNLGLREDPGRQFIEIANRATHAVNLRGAWFAEGIQYRFPTDRDVLLAPTQRMVFVRDLFRFQRTYGLEIPVAGIFSGRLDREGDRLSLIDAGGNVIFAFYFGTSDSSMPNVYSGEFSMVLTNPALGLDNPSAWRPSRRPGGSPGRPEPLQFEGEPRADADGDGFPAILEYQLGTSDTSSLEGPSNVICKLSEGLRFTISFPRNLGASDASLVVEHSKDLVGWSPAERIETRLISENRGEETWGALLEGAAEDHPHQFFRLRVEAAFVAADVSRRAN